MRQLVIAADDAADAKSGEKRGHDAGAEDARPAVIGVGMPASGVVQADVVVAADVPGEEQDHQEQEAERADSDVDQHTDAISGLTLSLPLASVNRRRAQRPTDSMMGRPLPSANRPLLP